MSSGGGKRERDKDVPQPAVSVKDERKLKPIFDLVDEGNYKQAICQLDKFLKKNTNAKPTNAQQNNKGAGGNSGSCVAAAHQAKALKCLCLWRMPGRQQEATEYADALIKEGPEDDGSLSVFSLCLRDMHKYTDIEDLYAKAVEKNPKNEDLLTCLVMAHVRTDNFKMQQLRALQLNKLSTASATYHLPITAKPFYFWAVMAVFQQGQKDKENGVKVQLPLARKMMEKSLSDSSKIGATKLEQVDLLLMILEELKDYASALKAFTTHVSVYDKELPVLRLRRQVEYMDELGSYDELIPICRDAISSMQSSADWIFFDKLMKAYVETKKQTKEEGSDPEEVELFHLGSLVEFLIAEREKNVKCIGHHFALLHLRKKMDEEKLSYSGEPQLPSMSSLVVSFYQSFGHKSPFFNYVRQCLSADVCDCLVGEVASKMRELESGKGDEVPLSLGDMYSLMSVCEVERKLARERGSLTEEQCVSRSETLTKLYRKYLPLGQELQSTEPQYSSKFMILASHYLIDAYMLSESREQKYLWTAVDRLKEALLDSPVDSQLLMVMLRIYQQMGLMQVSAELMDRMQIKQFLLQTTCWVVSNRLAGCGAHEEARLMHPALIRYIQSSVHQVPEYLIQGYRNGVYRKVVDMLQWKQSLLKSFAFIKCIVEEMMLDIIEIDSAKTLESRREESSEFLGDYTQVLSEWDAWEDDRDFDLNYSWEPAEIDWASEQIKKLSYDLELAWLKVRYTLVSTISLLMCSYNNKQKSTPKCSSLSISKLTSDFKIAASDSIAIWGKLRDHEFYKKMQGHPFSPFTCPLHLFVKLDLKNFYGELLDSVDDNNKTNMTNGDADSRSQTPKFSVISKSIISSVERMATDSFILANHQINVDNLMELKMVTEALAVFCLTISIQSEKQRRRAKDNGVDESISASPKLLLEKIIICTEKVKNRINETEWPAEVDAELLKNNLNSSLSQINKLCTVKIEYLKKMNF